MAVFGLVSSVAGFIKVRYLIDKAIIDNMVFRCHYRLTSAVLFLCCVLVTANNLIGEYDTRYPKCSGAGQLYLQCPYEVE